MTKMKELSDLGMSEHLAKNVSAGFFPILSTEEERIFWELFEMVEQQLKGFVISGEEAEMSVLA